MPHLKMSQNDSNNNRAALQSSNESGITLEDISMNPSSVSVILNNHIPSVTPRTQLKYTIYGLIRKCLWIYPLFVSILLPGFSLGAYVYAIRNKQMKAILPFISDTIGLAPQAGMATTFFTLVNACMLISAFLRYKQLKYYLTNKTTPSSGKGTSLEARQIEWFHTFNFISLISKLVGSFGMLLIASNRAPENPFFHFIGVTTFIFGVIIYFSIMVYLTSKLNASCGIESRPITLIITSYIGGVLLIIMGVLTLLSIYIAGMDNFFDNDWRFNWSEEQPAFRLHIASTTIEWIGFVGCGSILYLCLFWRFLNFSDWHKVRFA